MRWSYKTVNYELKKEGLLGNAFLDESEVELSLNEYGKAGWELVSILETQEGLIAVFKQPLSSSTQPTPHLDEEEDAQYVPLHPKKDDFTIEPEAARDVKQIRKRELLVTPVNEYEIVLDEKQEPPPTKDDIGSIRIE